MGRNIRKNEDSTFVRSRRVLNSLLRPKSISRRFSYAFVGVVALVCVSFATVAIFINIGRTDTEIKARKIALWRAR